MSRIWRLGALALIIGLSHGVYYPALSSLAAEHFYQSGTGTAMFIGPPVWAVLADLTTYGWIFVTSGSTLLLSTLAFV